MARILIVESDPHDMRAAVVLLENAGHDVLQANDARVAVNLARAYQPELVLMDMRLPGMEEMAVSRRMKTDATIRHSRVYVLTEQERLEEKDAMPGCDGFIVRPLRSAGFLKAIAEALTCQQRDGRPSLSPEG